MKKLLIKILIVFIVFGAVISLKYRTEINQAFATQQRVGETGDTLVQTWGDFDYNKVKALTVTTSFNTGGHDYIDFFSYLSTDSAKCNSQAYEDESVRGDKIKDNTITFDKLATNSFVKLIEFTYESPDTLNGDTLEIFTNRLERTIILESIWGSSPLDNHDFNLYKRNMYGGIATLVSSMLFSEDSNSTHYNFDDTITNDTLYNNEQWIMTETDSIGNRIHIILKVL